MDGPRTPYYPDITFPEHSAACGVMWALTDWSTQKKIKENTGIVRGSRNEGPQWLTNRSRHFSSG